MKKYFPKNSPPKNPFVVLFLVALGLAVATLLFRPDLDLFKDKAPQPISQSELVRKYQADELKSIQIKGVTVSAEGVDGQKYEAIKEAYATTADLGLNDPIKKTKVEIIDTSDEGCGKTF